MLSATKFCGSSDVGVLRVEGVWRETVVNADEAANLRPGDGLGLQDFLDRSAKVLKGLPGITPGTAVDVASVK